MDAPKTATSGKGTLLVFINPNGRPCQAQINELISYTAKISPYAEVEYVSTQKPEDRDIFYQYGIRSLPAMILLDKDHTIAKRYPPGIQYHLNFLPDLEAL